MFFIRITWEYIFIALVNLSFPILFLISTQLWKKHIFFVVTLCVNLLCVNIRIISSN